MLSSVEGIIAAQLANQPVESISDGYRHVVEPGVTELTFRPATGAQGQFELCAIATVETWFLRDMPDFSEAEIARLNRRSAFGNFYRSDDGLRVKLTFSIYRQEPAAHWVAELLLTALGHQLAFGIAAAEAELSGELLRANRANLEYPQSWACPVTQEQLAACAARFREAGFASTSGSHNLVLEVPLVEGGWTRVLEPTSETALIQAHTAIRHPIAGVGYLGTIALPIDPPPDEVTWWCRHLNAMEHDQQDFVPRLGAWSIRGTNDRLAYALFWPTDRGDVNAVSNIAGWLVQRTQWLRERFWVPGTGLHRSMAASNG